MRYDVQNINWKGVDIEINYIPDFGAGQTAHLELKSNKPNPITETGYRSHFAPKEHFELSKNIKIYVLEWLEREAKNKNWQAYSLEQQQPKLF